MPATTPVNPNWTPPKRPVPEVAPGQAYGLITCIPADEIPDPRAQRVTIAWGAWLPFVEEVLLRLECTPRSEALRIPFASEKLAHRAYCALTNYGTRNRIPGLIEARRVTRYLFVRRGEKWGKYPDPEHATLAPQK